MGNNRFSITAIGVDRPGIMAGISGALHEMGANLEDVSSSILRGSFGLMLVIELDGSTPETIRAKLQPAAEELGVEVTVLPVDETSLDRPDPSHSLSVYGSDRPGIVAAITGLLYRRAVNITDLSCRLVGEPGTPVYAMFADLVVPSNLSDATLESELHALGDELNVDVSLRSVDNEL